MSRLILATAVLAGLLLPGRASADETFHACRGFVTSTPAIIDAQGVWCLDRDLSTSATSGPAILITTNNVTLDCNGFKLGNLGAGPGTVSIGVSAVDRMNITVRGCNIRGFAGAILLEGGSGHVVEDNRVDAARVFGIGISGSSTARRNQIIDTGGTTSFPSPVAYAILFDGSAEVEDNLIDGFVAPPAMPGFSPVAISGEDAGFSRIVRNTIRNMTVVDPAANPAVGIQAAGRGTLVADNIVGGAGADTGYGIECGVPGWTVVRDNVVSLFPVPVSPACVASGNESLP